MRTLNCCSNCTMNVGRVCPTYANVFCAESCSYIGCGLIDSFLPAFIHVLRHACIRCKQALTWSYKYSLHSRATNHRRVMSNVSKHKTLVQTFCVHCCNVQGRCPLVSAGLGLILVKRGVLEQACVLTEPVSNCTFPNGSLRSLLMAACTRCLNWALADPWRLHFDSVLMHGKASLVQFALHAVLRLVSGTLGIATGPCRSSIANKTGHCLPEDGTHETQ